MIKLGKYSIGVGDRFGHQARAQIRAVQALKDAGIAVVPVWNKSFREHSLIGTHPADTRRAADAAVVAEKWTGGYFLDADHISLKNVETFIPTSDFFTLDVADFIGKPVATADCEAFADRHPDLIGRLTVAGIDRPLELDRAMLLAVAAKYLAAICAAGNLYRHIAAVKKSEPFVTEVSMDETATPQTPVELLVILAGLADEQIPLQTIAPKFTGAFHKGIDYIGDPAAFAREFDEDVCVIRFAIGRFNLPGSLKLSVHSGSDKFSLYPHIAASLKRHQAGVHLKTAGTSWLEEVIGLAAAGGDGLAIAKTIYRRALPQFDALCVPYASVVSINPARLPRTDAVDQWSSAQFVGALEHNAANPLFNDTFRQFIHISFRIAAEMGATYTDALDAHAGTIGGYVTRNLLERHLKPLFLNP
jgi:hypothetical protein